MPGGVPGAAAILHAQQLGPAAIEFVIADRVEIEPDQVHRQDGRLVEEAGRDERRGADQVAGRDGETVGMAGAQAAASPKRNRRRRRPARGPRFRPARPPESA